MRPETLGASAAAAEEFAELYFVQEDKDNVVFATERSRVWTSISGVIQNASLVFKNIDRVLEILILAHDGSEARVVHLLTALKGEATGITTVMGCRR